ncbi:MAG: prepilin-type N-terminal cleavage/methylation domain-containing protein [Cystobacterineae bacterium]|nr:prepilin-type N-terminal cleavage/methylation domain-containing protein [Cystobacterineae bacterium]
MKKGLTLIELMVSIALLSIISLSMGSAFSAIINSSEILEENAETSRSLRVAFSRLCRELSSSFISDRYDIRRYQDAYGRPTNFVGTKDKLLFTTFAHQRLYQDAKESDQMLVEYQLQNSKGQKDIMRRQKTVLDGRVDEGGGTENVFLENVDQLEFSYWDTFQKNWVDEWDTRKAERKSSLPSRIKIAITLNESGTAMRYVTQVQLTLTRELSRYE